MKRLHVHVAVEDICRSVSFYSTLSGTEPTVLKNDCAKWMPDDPRVNFAISNHMAVPGQGHLGIQTESGDEHTELTGRLKAAGETTRDQEGVARCCAKSNKSWVNEPNGLRWETFLTTAEAVTCGEDERPVVESSRADCCAPAIAAEPARAATRS